VKDGDWLRWHEAFMASPANQAEPGKLRGADMGGFTERPSDAHQAQEHDDAVRTMAAPHLRNV